MKINLFYRLEKEIFSIVKDTIIKYDFKAFANETVDTRRDADEYVRAYTKQDKFLTYPEYSIEVLQLALPTETPGVIQRYHENRDEIPLNLRQTVLNAQRKYVVDNYVEKNNYYRELNGLPPYETKPKDFVFVDEDVANKYGIDKTVPIHELSKFDLSTLYAAGYLNRLILKYPERKYLRHLHVFKVDPVIARTAKNFSLLYVPKNSNSSILERFIFIYGQCREYFVSCIYIREHANSIDFYNEFIAMCIMLMTIQQFLARAVKYSIERDFFDDYNARTLFDTYSVPYYAELDEATKKLLIQNLNLLVLNKGTNKVIYDISSILGYSQIEVWKYFLVKSQKYDIHDAPIPVTPGDINSYKEAFDIFFQKVKLDDVDVHSSLHDRSRRVAYEQVVNKDPYWYHDADLEKVLYESEYNYVETKYMGLSIMYRMSTILFENVYLLKMILDNKDKLPLININIPKLAKYDNIPLFDAIVILCAMACKKNGLKGEIITGPSKILHIMGFNFQLDYELIRNSILEDPLLDDSLVDYFKKIEFLNHSDVNDMYANFLKLQRLIVDKMSSTNNINVYLAYKKFYDMIFYTDDMTDVFNIGTASDPKYPATFLDYVLHAQPDVYTLIKEADDVTLGGYIEHLCNRVLTIVPRLKTFGILYTSSSQIESVLVGLITFFKSYTVDMLDLKTVYLIDVKPESLIRWMDDYWIKTRLYYKDNAYMSYSDSMKIKKRDKLYSKLNIRDAMHNIHIRLKERSMLSLTDSISMKKRAIFLEKINMRESIHIDKLLREYSDLKLADRIRYEFFLKLKESLRYRDVLNLKASLYYKTLFGLLDVIYDLKKNIRDADSLLFTDEATILLKAKFKDEGYSLRDISKFVTYYHESVNLLLNDKMSISSILRDSSRILFRESTKSAFRIDYSDKKFIGDDTIHLEKGKNISDNSIGLFDSISSNTTRLRLSENSGNMYSQSNTFFRDSLRFVR